MGTANVCSKRPRRNHILITVVTLASTLTMTPTATGQQCTPGDVAWIHQFGTAATEQVSSVAVDPTGSIYVAGTTEGTLPGQASAGFADVFVRKYDPNGSEEWTRQFGTAGADLVSDVTVDAIGNVYLAGSFATGVGRQAFLRKYDESGIELWTRTFGDLFADALGVAADPAGYAYVSGDVLGTLPGQSPAGGFDAFVRKYDASGNLVWTRQFGTPNFDRARDVAVDAAGNVSVTGEVSGALPGQISAGGNDIFVRQYDSSGSEMWTHQFGASGNDLAAGVAVDNASNVFVTGGVTDALTGQIWMGGLFDVFLRKFDAGGSELWTREFGTPLVCPGCFGFDLPYGVAVDAAGNAYVGGTVGGPLPNQTYAGGGDAFVRMYDPNGSELFTKQFGSPFSDYVRGVGVKDASLYLAGVTFGVLEGENPGLNWDAYAAKIFARDIEPPSLSVVVSPDTLWPPDHRLVDVSASITVSDACDANPTVTLVSVTSNEPDNGIGDGDTTNDIQIVDLETLRLRAERASIGSGRVYTATYVATDASGNVSPPVSVTVAVPLK